MRSTYQRHKAIEKDFGIFARPTLTVFMMHYFWIGTYLLAVLTQTSLARTFYPVAVTGYHRTTRRSSSSSLSPPVWHVARKTSSTPRQRSKKNEELIQIEPETRGNAVNYAELGPVGRIVAGAVEVAVSTGLEFLSGFMGGYALGTVTEVPRLLFRSTNQPTFLKETSSRFVRLNSKSIRWAKSWGGISAAFGGFNVLIKVVRGGKEDDWNSIISSTAAGVFFARKGT